MPGGGCALPGLRFVRPAVNVFTALDPPVALPLTGATALCDLVARRRRNAPPPGKNLATSALCAMRAITQKKYRERNVF